MFPDSLIRASIKIINTITGYEQKPKNLSIVHIVSMRLNCTFMLLLNEITKFLALNLGVRFLSYNCIFKYFIVYQGVLFHMNKQSIIFQSAR